MKNRYKLLKITFYLSLLLVFTSCKKIYEKNVELAEQGWHMDSLKVFEFEVIDASQPHNIYYNIKSTVSYPFHNLYVNYYIEDILGNQQLSGLQEMDLFDPKSGEPLGDGLSKTFNHRFLALENYLFKSPGTYRVKLQHNMRSQVLPGLLKVGLRVEVAD